MTWADENPPPPSDPILTAETLSIGPTLQPTSPPTTVDTIGVSVSMSVALGGWLSESNAEILKTEIAAAIGVDPSSIVDFSSPTRAVPFAVSSSTQCAENLPYGPCASELTNESSAMLCTDHKDTDHTVWSQDLYNNGAHQFSIRWEFLSGPKTLEQRFLDAVASWEEVVWTVTPAAGTSFGLSTPNTTVTAFWRFSNSANIGTKFSYSGSYFSSDDGIWGGAPYNLDGNYAGALGSSNSWGQQNYNSADSSYCDYFYANGNSYTSSGIKNVMSLGEPTSNSLTFSVVVSLSQTSAATPAAFAAHVEAALAMTSFSDAVALLVPGSVVDTASIVVNLHERSGGYCFSGDSMVLVKNGRASSVVPRKLTEVRVGDKVLAMNHQHQKRFSAVKQLPHSASVGNFIDIRFDSSASSSSSSSLSTSSEVTGLSATEHHTFPTCENASPVSGNLRHSHAVSEKNKGQVAAHELKEGDCLLTLEGERTVTSVQRRLAEATDVTYTVELEGNTDLLVVGGVVTHAKPSRSDHAVMQELEASGKTLVDHSRSKTQARLAAWRAKQAE